MSRLLHPTTDGPCTCYGDERERLRVSDRYATTAPYVSDEAYPRSVHTLPGSAPASFVRVINAFDEEWDKLYEMVNDG